MPIDIVAKARRIESALAETFDGAARRLASSGSPQPLELMTAIVDAAAARLEPAGRGTFVFPYNRITVSIVAGGREAQSRVEAVFERAPSLRERVAERLRHGGCPASDLVVDVQFVDCRDPHWTEADFHLAFDRVTLAPAAVSEDVAPSDHLRVTIVAGSAQKPTYGFTLNRINLGRCHEVRDGRHRLIRTNHVAFSDGESNHTVSRRHAHIDREPVSGHYRVCDDGSAHGTSIVRHGRTIAVPTGARGVRLQSGDEIALGEARLRVRFSGPL